MLFLSSVVLLKREVNKYGYMHGWVERHQEFDVYIIVIRLPCPRIRAQEELLTEIHSSLPLLSSVGGHRTCKHSRIHCTKLI